MRERIAQVESELAERDNVAERKRELAERLTELRTKVGWIEENAAEQFDKHMDAISPSPVTGTSSESGSSDTGRRSKRDAERPSGASSTSTWFAGEDGKAYEDTVDHLSESEREVTGLLFALAGYPVHDVHGEIPFMLLDSLEAIDAERVAALVDYFAEYTPRLVVAFLPEDAEALDDSYNRATSV